MKQCRLKKRACILLTLVAILFLWVSTTPAADKGKPPAKKNESSAATCLACHGPFEKLTSASPKFVTEKGETITPHRYVPHDLKEIPDCVSCHKPHSMKPTKDELAALPKPDVKTCYNDCHHAENFKRCKSCH